MVFQVPARHVLRMGAVPGRKPATLVWSQTGTVYCMEDLTNSARGLPSGMRLPRRERALAKTFGFDDATPKARHIMKKPLQQGDRL